MAPPREPEWAEAREEAIRGQLQGAGQPGEGGPYTDLLQAPASLLGPARPGAEGQDREEALTTGPVSIASYPYVPPASSPPDIHLTVGKDYVIAGYNSFYAVYNKVTGRWWASTTWPPSSRA